MIYSMTGYANEVIQIDDITLQIDIRSVNQRFLDLNIKSPEEFKPLEYLIRERITNLVSRGKVDLRIHYHEHTTDKVTLNTTVLNNYIQLAHQIKECLPDAKLDNISQIMTLPGMLSVKTFDIELIKDQILNAITKLTVELQHNQQIEGTKLADIILGKLDQIDQIVTKALAIMPTIRQNYQDRLRKKLFDILGEAINNEQRFQQEFAHFCQKIDVDEELSRLNAHIKHFRDILAAGGKVGKKIDFVTQEMHREANTFGAKSASLDTTTQAIELKILIEQIKEQVQNIM